MPPSSKVPDYKAANPLSRQLTDGRLAIVAQATIQMPALEGFLKSHFNGKMPAHPDEAFLGTINMAF